MVVLLKIAAQPKRPFVTLSSAKSVVGQCLGVDVPNDNHGGYKRSPSSPYRNDEVDYHIRESGEG